MTTTPAATGPLGLLAGVRVIDLTSTLAGPYGTQLLGDLGADVIKVEPPAGDPLRDLGPRRHEGMGAVFLGLNRTKRSVVLDLGTEDGRASLHRLCGRADVAVHNLRPDTALRLGADAPTLRAGHPRLIHCAIRGFGQGPYGDLPAYDDVVQAASGIAALQGAISGSPHYVANALADKVAGMMAAMAVSAALYRRQLSGEGCAVEVPMFESATAFALVEHLFGKTFVPPLGPIGYPRQASPMRKLYRTADGWLAVVVYTNEHWARFFALIGRPELAADERFSSLNARTQHLDEVLAVVEGALAEATSAEWLARLEAAGIPARSYRTLDEVLVDPHLVSTGFFQGITHPTEGDLLTMPTPLRVDGQRPGPGAPAPELGADTAAVLGALGPTEDEPSG